MADDLSKLTLVAVETAHIQSYIFSSNRLKENVGASFLVAAATEEWALASAYKATKASCNIVINTQGSYMLDVKQDNPIKTKNAEVLYSSGGNFVALFRDENHARDFARRLSQQIICEAPGLQITIHNKPFNWIVDTLSYAVSDILNQLKTKRSQQPTRMGLAGLGVTVMCASTSLPAVWTDKTPDDEWQPVSAEVMAKRKAAGQANDDLRKVLHLSNGYRFPLELDDLGRTKGESSYMAVVHADGNGMGELIQGLKEKFPTPDDNRPYIDYMRNFSEDVKRAAWDSQRAAVQRLVASIETDENGAKFIMGLNDQSPIELSRDKKTGEYILPLRPLVSGGDDVTFVCDGRIGIELAAVFLQEFEGATANYFGQTLTACAGAAIVKSHYPFARAYELAEELCQSAKQARYDMKVENSAIDWHFTAGGLYGALDEMRQREYVLGSGRVLTIRPVFLGNDAHEYRTWETMQRVATEFQTQWRNHRSKAKGLMKALHGGASDTNAFKARYLATSAEEGKKLKLPYLPEANFHTYYDALELMDLYFPLRGEVAKP